MNKEQIIEKVMEGIEQGFNERQKKPYQYVVAYYRTSDDSLMGYHADSFCNLTDREENGKRYNGDNPYDQLAIIRRNLDHTLDKEPSDDQGISGLFGGLSDSTKERHYKGMKKEDIYIQAEYLDEGIAPQRFTYKVINK
jgi:hypothetical protein